MSSHEISARGVLTRSHSETGDSLQTQQPPSETASATGREVVDAAHLTVVIVTWNRPQHVKSCLEHLRAQDLAVRRVVVVDASDDDRTAAVCRLFNVVHVEFPAGAGHMTTARNEGLRHVTGVAVAFLDDDTRPFPSWHREIVLGLSATKAAALAGRTLNVAPGEDDAPAEMVGRIAPDGMLTGNFAARLPAPIPVEHGIGANMVFRTSVMGDLGGFRDDFEGTALREDTDMFLRLRRLGHVAYFCPNAVVRHVAADHVVGKRFDRRYQFYARRNHAQLLGRNYGWASSIMLRWTWAQILADFRATRRHDSASIARRVWRLAHNTLAIASGWWWVLRYASPRPGDPRRTDAIGRELRELLGTSAGAHLPGR